MASSSADMSILSLILNASIPVQVIMLLLVLISILSWTFIFGKRSTLRREQALTRRFENDFWSGGDLNMLQQSVSTHRNEHGALARIFDAGMTEFTKVRRNPPADHAALLDGPNRAMRAAYQREVDSLESNLNFLASAGSVSPYIGLLGTVWGIMHAFVGLAHVQQATLASVAPGIAEALIATAIGLFAAIPAVVAYNRYTHDIDRLALRFENFMDEFLNILQRQVR
ncbi:protein TolQ [Kerstersia gyiorum]|jgi:biopolymer transport protein TolQ|uniref:protein TolQ n=1 Tax=Kerstersia gyiorum TaxID=206506 RepID=UPI000FD8C089|nr:protein TolQ [Kerstersia gyiorum]AZV92758.1 protein TolQ [Bordetella sp. J329]MCH4272961.1 protein TolQ [Kerstersia gyiorum]MCI1228862.1 protein TolQ [Kerstersia gyiorum]MCP1633950.1 biopolymer transport protein TolQ [Kerstersia gyiorum]MCP1637390.1 biopolymer transport protein TolQ [Kerstersia gyiorum]